jgi:hypothetical protein
MLRSPIAGLPADLFVQARALACDAFSDPLDAYGRLAPTSVLIAVDGDKVVGHLFEYERAVGLGDRSVMLGLIGDVAVSTERRGEGICKILLRSTHAHFRERSIEFSVLFAFEPPIYRSSGYVPMRNTTRFLDKDGEWKTLVHRGGMAAALGARPWPHDPLDLKGPAV